MSTNSLTRPRWRTALAAAAELIWPRFCFICDAKADDETSPYSICQDCRKSVVAEPLGACPRCTSTVGPFADTSKGCPRCKGVTFRFASAVRLGPYDGTLRTAILRMKQQTGDGLAETMGCLWSAERREELLAGSPTVVVPIPLHWRRRWARGYNQSEALARGVAEGLGLPCRPGALMRVRPTPSQRPLSPTARWDNVRGAFRPGRRQSVRGMTVLLIDDVLTTGATADAAAWALLEAGAAQVRLGILAHR